MADQNDSKSNVHIPVCLPPLPISAQEPASFAMPAGACDTHAHVVSADRDRFPMVPDRTYTPHPAPEDDYLEMLAANGASRGVLVQISVYGTDNRYMLDVLRNHPDTLRGVAVAAPTITDAELEAMHAAGVRGLRLNVLFGGGIGFDAMETLAHRIKEFGWHLQFLLDARQLPELLPRMKKLPTLGVIDHMGHMPVSEGTSSAGFQALQHMVKEHGWWVKLSGSYRISQQFDTYADVVPWARALVETAPDQMVWGSDWPHVHIAPMVNTGKLRNQLIEWVPDEATRRKILVDNPQRLYDFPPR